MGGGGAEEVGKEGREGKGQECVCMDTCVCVDRETERHRGMRDEGIKKASRVLEGERV